MADSIIVFPPGFRLLDASGNAISGGYYEFYDAGTSTPKTVYSDYTLSTSLGSTVYCDTGGHTVTTQGGSTKCVVYTGTAAYKIIAKNSAGTTQWTQDNLRGASDLSIYSTVTASNNEPTLSKSANYTVVVGDGYKTIVCTQSGGSFTLTLPSAVTMTDGWWVEVYLKSPDSTNTVTLATVSSQTIAHQDTAATSLVLSGGGSGGKLKSDGANWIWEPYQNSAGGYQPSTTIASASTCNIGASSSSVVSISGTTTITSFGTLANAVRLVHFQGALTLTHNATSLILPDAANITTVAGDTALFVSDSSGNWRCWYYDKINATQSDMETGTSTTAVVTPGTMKYHKGVAKCGVSVTYSGGTPSLVAADSFNITSITDEGIGDLTVTIADDLSTSTYIIAGTAIVSTGNYFISPVSRAAGSCRINVRNAGGSAVDPDALSFAVFGDFA